MKSEIVDDIIYTTVSKYELFYSYDKVGQDAFLLWNHLQYTARKQGVFSVFAEDIYLKKGLKMGIKRLKPAKALLVKLGLIKYNRKRDEKGKFIGKYIQVFASTGVKNDTGGKRHAPSQHTNTKTNNINTKTNNINTLPDGKKSDLFDKIKKIFHDGNIELFGKPLIWNGQGAKFGKHIKTLISMAKSETGIKANNLTPVHEIKILKSISEKAIIQKNWIQLNEPKKHFIAKSNEFSPSTLVCNWNNLNEIKPKDQIPYDYYDDDPLGMKEIEKNQKIARLAYE
jgi:hypothetical protein